MNQLCSLKRSRVNTRIAVTQSKNEHRVASLCGGVAASVSRLSHTALHTCKTGCGGIGALLKRSPATGLTSEVYQSPVA